MRCLLCTVRSASSLLACSGFSLPVCSTECGDLLHALLTVQTVSAPLKGGSDDEPSTPPPKRKADADADAEEQGAKRAKESPSGSPLGKLTALLVSRLQQSGDPEAAQRLQVASTQLLSDGAVISLEGWNAIPAEVKLLILSGLPILRVLRLGGLSREMYQITRDEHLWRHFCTGPLANVFGTPRDRLCLRSWREQGLTLLRSKSYVIRRPNNPIRPVVHISLPDEAQIVRGELDTPLRGNLVIRLNPDSFRMQVLPAVSTLKSIRIHFKVPPTQALPNLPKLSDPIPPVDEQRWVQASTVTLVTWSLVVGQPSNAWNQDFPLPDGAFDELVLDAVPLPTAPDYTGPAWKIVPHSARIRNSVLGEQPISEAHFQQQKLLHLELDFRDRLIDFSGASPEPAFASELVKHNHLSEDQQPYLWRYMPAGRLTLGLVTTYTLADAPARMAIVPTNKRGLWDHQRSYLQLTHDVEGIAQKLE